MQSIIKYLNDHYKVVQDCIRPKQGAGSRNASLDPKRDVVAILMQNIEEVGNIPPNDVVAVIEEWKTEQSNPEAVSPRLQLQIDNPYNRLTDYDKTMFNTFRWFLKQGKQQIVMLSDKPNTYTMLDPTTRLFPNIAEFPNRKTQIENYYTATIVEAYKGRRRAHLLVWDMKTQINTEGELAYPRYNLDEYY